MMQAFRNAAKPIMVVVAITFFAWLVLDLSGITGGTGLLTNTSVGKVNGQSIDARTYQTIVQQSINARQQQSPGNLGLEDYEQVRNEVWNQIVQSRVLEAEYRRRGITVTEDEVVQAIRNSPLAEFQNVPEFQTDSQFDLAKYQRWLTSSIAQQYLPSLEAQYREELQRAKLLRVVTADVYLSDAALWERYRDENETVKIGLTAIVPRNVVADSAVKVTSAEAEAYYKANSDEFKRPRTAYLSYVALARATTSADTAAMRALADSVRQEIAGGAPFAEVATRESADSASAAKGGRPRRVDQGSDGSRVRLRCVCPAAQDGLEAGALAVRVSPDRDHKPKGEQGKGTSHPVPHRGDRSSPGPARCSGRQSRKPGGRSDRSGRAGYRRPSTQADSWEIGTGTGGHEGPARQLRRS